jgi:hypothetical protein
MLLSLVLVILALEQKNLARSMYEQISFISLITLFILLNSVILKLKNKVDHKLLMILVFNFIFISFLIISFDRNFRFDKGSYSFSERNAASCVEKKLRNINSNDLKSHKKVLDYLKNKNAVVFSFPADPIFYVLLNQRPPYYPSIYEATPIDAQIKLIDYIKDSNVKYVIINTNTPAIQDNVPNEKRVRLLFKYISENFKEQKVINNFLILEKI